MTLAKKIARLKLVADGLRRIQEFESATYLDAFAKPAGLNTAPLYATPAIPAACACGAECRDTGHGNCRYATPPEIPVSAGDAVHLVDVVWKALDKVSCPGAYMTVAAEAVAKSVNECTLISDYELGLLREHASVCNDAGRGGDLWYWQGDGYDVPESITCPVVMSAGTLRELIANTTPPPPAGFRVVPVEPTEESK